MSETYSLPLYDIGGYSVYKNQDKSISIYRNMKFIAAIESTTASQDLIMNMGKRIEELEKQNKILLTILNKNKSNIHDDRCSSLMDSHCMCDCMNSEIKQIIKIAEEK